MVIAGLANGAVTFMIAVAQLSVADYHQWEKTSEAPTLVEEYFQLVFVR